MMKDCLFCKIATKKLPSDILYEDEKVIAFSDLTPQAPQHKLIIPKKHISTLNDLTADDTAIAGQLFFAAQMLAKKLNIADSGYRVVMNCNEQGGQQIFHIHLHLLGGREMQWPPG